MSDDTKQFVAFRVGRHHLAVDIASVKEILRPMEVTPLPGAPSFIEGVIDLRGAVIPVIDLRGRFVVPTSRNEDNGDTESGPTGQRGATLQDTRYVIASIDRRIFALVVDAVTEVIRMPAKSIRPAPGFQSESQPVTHVFHYNDALHLVLSLSKLLTSAERVDLEDFSKNLTKVQEGNEP